MKPAKKLPGWQPKVSLTRPEVENWGGDGKGGGKKSLGEKKKRGYNEEGRQKVEMPSYQEVRKKDPDNRPLMDATGNGEKKKGSKHLKRSRHATGKNGGTQHHLQ